MLDARIYRTGLIAVALAAIVVAFSLGDQQGPITTAIPPVAFNGQNAYANMVGLARQFPSRRPGSTADDELAGKLAVAFRGDGFSVSTTRRRGNTAEGPRELETVTAVRAGLSGPSIVIVSHRDSLRSPSVADLSGTAVLLELGRVLSGETQHRTIVLASTTGSAGAAGATQLARRITGPIDAVIALGDLAGSGTRQPVVVPWSNGKRLASPQLRNTLAWTLAQQASMRPGGTTIAGQLAHLAFPLTTGEQGPFGALAESAVLLSLSGDRAPAADEPVPDSGRITALGQTVLESVNALDGGPTVTPPSTYLLFSGKLVPAWGVRLLVLTLLLPVLMAMIDGLARARRRGHSIRPWVCWVLLGALPFLLAAMITRASQLVGLLHAPPAPVPAGDVPLHAAGIAVLVAALVAIVGSFLAWRPLARRVAGGERLGSPANPGAAAAVLLVMCLAALAIWIANPFAALLLVPALHLWLWIVDPDRRIPRLARLAMLLAGAAPVVLVVLYYADALGLGGLGVAWEGVLLLAGGHVSLLTATQWCVVLGCSASIVVIVVRMPRRERRREPVPEVTVRGPVGYAGPGSLGGTESALRR
jgi:hypothetical protein